MGNATSADRGCALCGGKLTKVVDHPHGKICAAFQDIAIARCGTCSYERAQPWPTAGQLAKFYNTQYKGVMQRHYSTEPLDPKHFAARRAAAQAAFIRDAASNSFGGQPDAIEQFDDAVKVIAEGGAGWGRLLREFAFGEGAVGRKLHMFEYEEQAIAYARDVECGGCVAQASSKTNRQYRQMKMACLQYISRTVHVARRGLPRCCRGGRRARGGHG